ncbi:hypothetical protein QUA81_21760 [Microcoleus sp. F6_B4]
MSHSIARFEILDFRLTCARQIRGLDDARIGDLGLIPRIDRVAGTLKQLLVNEKLDWFD